MDSAGELAKLLQTERELFARSRKQLSGACRIVGKPRLGEAKPERERHQALLRAVVEVPLEPPSLCVAGLDDARARCVQLLAGLRVRERDGDETRERLEPLLDSRRKRAGATAIRDRGGPPESPRHHDRSGHSRAHLGGKHALAEVGRLRLQIDPRRSARLRDARDGAALERKLHAEWKVDPSDPLPGADDHRAVQIVDVAHDCSAVGVEQPADLLRDDDEEPLRILLGGDGDGNAAEGGLLVGQRGELLAGLSVRECDRDEVRELLEASLGVGWESLGAVDRDRGRAPESPGDHDRRRYA